MVTPPPVCVEKKESVFSVTGFLTFTVVSATAVSNIITNIDNNNNNNNNNDNNDNVNNNNQISDSSDATNMGNARGLGVSPPSTIPCLPLLLCLALQDIQAQGLTTLGTASALVGAIISSTSYFVHLSFIQLFSTVR